MGNNLTPEPRADKNGKIVVRHVKSDFVATKPLPASIPKPSVSTRSILQSVRLKEMDSGALTLTLLSDVRGLEKAGEVDYDTVFGALDAATFLHLHQTRENRKNLPRTPYIEHPLRNTIRAVRWGCKDQDVLVATLLHDTVEDCADEIITFYLGRKDTDSLDSHTKREMALDWVEQSFGSEVRRLVHAVSNPVSDGRKRTEREKHEAYVDHVSESIEDDAKVFLVKFADFVDNAVGLPHNNVEGNREAVTRRARKYLLAVDVFEREYESNSAIRDLVNSEGYESIWNHIQEAKQRLVRLANQQSA